MNIDTGGGGAVNGNVGTGGDFIGRDEADHRNMVNVHYEERPLAERDRVDWRDRQIAELRYALLGDDRFGVSGMVDAVRNQRIWLIILTVLVALVMFILIWQGVQIHQILQRLG